MLGSRFDLLEAVNEISQQRAVSEPGVAEPICASVDEYCAQIEREMMEVALTLHSNNAKIAVFCPVCDTRMGFRCEHDLQEFGSLDIKLHQLECTTCGMTTGRVFHPSVGYHTPVR